MSRAPQLLACFLFPMPVENIRCLLRTDDIAPSSQPYMLAEQTMWTSDPENRLLSLVTDHLRLVFIISTRVFFDLGTFEGVEGAIPWKYWGPLNSRVFEHYLPCEVGVSGNRVVQSIPVDGMSEDNAFNSEHMLRMMDFSPLAVERRQGLGQVVTEPSTIEITTPQKECRLTTSLPYVEVVSNGESDYHELVEIWVDKDRIYLAKEVKDLDILHYLEVIEFNGESVERPRTNDGCYNQHLLEVHP